MDDLGVGSGGWIPLLELLLILIHVQCVAPVYHLCLAYTVGVDNPGVGAIAVGISISLHLDPGPPSLFFVISSRYHQPRPFSEYRRRCASWKVSGYLCLGVTCRGDKVVMLPVLKQFVPQFKS